MGLTKNSKMAETGKKRQFRRRKYSSSTDDESEKEDPTSSAVEDMKEIQKLRKRQRGVNAAELGAGDNNTKQNTVVKTNDPFKMKSGGGFIDMKELKQSGAKGDDEEEDEVIGTSFAAETNRRDEDADMLTYVEEELNKRKGINKVGVGGTKHKTMDDVLLDCSETLRMSAGKKTEDMLSNQMLSGIPEVDLGIEAKIRNIEATEESKQKLIDERRKKKEQEVSDFVPTNMAVNFVQHNRFNIEDSTPLLKQGEAPKVKPLLRVGDAEKLAAKGGKSDKGQTDKATDDFHYEKFKKQMRR